MPVTAAVQWLSENYYNKINEKKGELFRQVFVFIA